MMKRFWQLVYWFKGVWLGVKGMRHMQLGSRVFHDGEWWYVSNWANGPHMNLSGGGRWGHKRPYKEFVPKEEIRPSRSPAEFIHRFRSMRRWYMTSWFVIDVYRAAERLREV